jgi:predicted nuclease of restriction endonuclease-like (RecB) superfamily
MSDQFIVAGDDYKNWLKDLKLRIRSIQLKAAISVNRELLQFYWELGADIVQKQANSHWGDGFLQQVSVDLMAEFPEMKGFSKRNLELIRQWYCFWSLAGQIAKQPVSQIQIVDNLNTTLNQTFGIIGQQPVGQTVKQFVLQLPWGHNIAIISKCKDIKEAVYYGQQTLQNNWSRSVLVHQIESGLYQREGKAISNFAITLPQPQSDLALQTLKDPYIFDFLTMTREYSERDLEKALVDHITHFLLELGAGFAYMGRQVPLHVGERDFFIDLLFYHTRLHCHIVIELKTVEFEPEHTGKLNFYIKAIDEQLRKIGDEPTIGILLCKGKDNLVAEYALSDIHKPIGVSEYELTRSLPENLKGSLPSIEEIEAEMSRSEEVEL